MVYLIFSGIFVQIFKNMIYLLIPVLIGFFLYFEFKIRKISKSPSMPLDINYPKSIIQEFCFEDLEDSEQYIIDLINLVISEKWNILRKYSMGGFYLFTKDDLGLVIYYTQKVDKNGKTFTTKFNRLEFGKIRQRKTKKQYAVFDEYIFTHKRSGKNFKKSNSIIDNLLHQCIYNDMVDNYNITKEKTLKIKSKLDDILIQIIRDRKLNNLLDK